MSGARVGYQHTSIRPVTEQGRKVVRIERIGVVQATRFGQPSDTEIRYVATETIDGRLLVFDHSMRQNGQSMRVVGRVDGDSLLVTISNDSGSQQSDLPWKPEYRGMMGVQRSLWDQPMQPGGQRTIPTFDLEGLVHNQLTARTIETVEVDGAARELLRIDAAMQSERAELKAQLWVDADGTILRTRLENVIESYVTTRERALEGTDGDTAGASLDLGLDVMVPLDRSIDQPHATRRVRYRVTLADADPTTVFPRGTTQEVERVDAHSALVTVHAVRPGQLPPHVNTEAESTSDEDLASNLLITSAAPSVAALARRIDVDPAASSWEKAVAVERWVHQHMKTGDFTKGLSPASEVADTLSGDCTEYAVLTAAVLRHWEIPARVAVGMVYADKALGYHMWTEVHVDGRWIPIDATIGQGGIGGGHIKIADLTFADPMGMSAMFPVLKVISKVEVAVVEID